jgi:uncharacterized protein
LGHHDRTIDGRRLNIAVIGSGISGLACAWLLAQRHSVIVYESGNRIGGHSHTVDVNLDGLQIAVDTGFIVYNEPAYPNLTALFRALEVPTVATDMSFAVSLERGAYEYAGGTIAGLLAQPSNLLKARFWSMLRDLLRFYREAPRDLPAMGEMSLDAYLDAHHYGRAFRDDHLYPMAAAIWSTPALDVGRHPAATFVRFCENHGLLKISGRPVWRTVRGGSREYVARLAAPLEGSILTSCPVTAIRRQGSGVDVVDDLGGVRRFDHAVLACHADTALRLLANPDNEERRILGMFRYSRNEAVLHTDTGLMPRRRAAWGSWNYITETAADGRRLSVTYWMNRLQPLGTASPLFVTLNPVREPRDGSVISREVYEHPLFDGGTLRAQRELWSLQGRRNTWFCGAYFGAGFHEDGLQAGLAVAEDLGGMRRPWQVADDSARIVRGPPTPACSREQTP